MPQRITAKKYQRIDTTVGGETIDLIGTIARKIERSTGRRYAVSKTEVIELAIDWMAGQPQGRRKNYQQVPRLEGEREPFHLGVRMPARTVERLHDLGNQLTQVEGYEKPHRTRDDRPNLGDTIDWCVAHFAAALTTKRSA